METIVNRPDILLRNYPAVPNATYSKIQVAFNPVYKKIRRIYMRDSIAQAVLNHFTELSDSEISIDVDTLLKHVPNLDNVRQRTIQVLKTLEEEQLGKFTTGRRGHKSRFEAPRGLRALSEILESKTYPQHAPSQQPKPTHLDGANSGTHQEPARERVGTKTLTHQFMVRPDFPLSITLPVDLTGTEASRLADFIKSLPFH
jgi:hypothetical protein